MRWAVLVLALGGCELFDFPNGTLDRGDGGNGSNSCPAIACVAPTPACDLPSGTCVECVANSDCATDEPACDPAVHTCRGCREDSECDSGACLPDGSCAASARILYAAPGATGTTCAQTDACSLDAAAAKVSATQDVVKLATGTYEQTAAITFGANVIVLGGDSTVHSAGGITQFSGAGVAMTFDRIAIDAETGIAISCNTAGKVTTVRTKLTRGAAGLIASNCEAHLDRTLITGNTVYGMLVNTGPLTMTSSFVVKNGSGGQFGGMLLQNLVAGSTMEHVTIAGNVASMGITGVRCGTSMVAIKSSIIYTNTIDPMCTVTYSVVDAAYAGGANNVKVDPQFVNAAGTDYHIGATSPAKGAADPASMVPTDYDGEVRPQPANSTPDCGADELP